VRPFCENARYVLFAFAFLISPPLFCYNQAALTLQSAHMQTKMIVAVLMHATTFTVQTKYDANYYAK
jgi:hypothetical protein